MDFEQLIRSLEEGKKVGESSGNTTNDDIESLGEAVQAKFKKRFIEYIANFRLSLFYTTFSASPPPKSQ